MTTWPPAPVAAAAITLTYLFCVRPLSRGRVRQPESGAEEQTIALLGEERRVLRTQRSVGERRCARHFSPERANQRFHVACVDLLFCRS